MRLANVDRREHAEALAGKRRRHMVDRRIERHVDESC